VRSDVTADLSFLAFLLITNDSVGILNDSLTAVNTPRNGPAKTDGDMNLCYALALTPSPAAPRGAGPS